MTGVSARGAAGTRRVAAAPAVAAPATCMNLRLVMFMELPLVRVPLGPSIAIVFTLYKTHMTQNGDGLWPKDLRYVPCMNPSPILDSLIRS